MINYKQFNWIKKVFYLTHPVFVTKRKDNFFEALEAGIQTETVLKPCPFCGGEAELFQRELAGCDHDYSNDDDNWDVRCRTIACYLSDGADWWLFKDIAIQLWNGRK